MVILSHVSTTVWSVDLEKRWGFWPLGLCYGNESWNMAFVGQMSVSEKVEII